MTIRHIRIFIAVYRAMNMTRAAEELHMAQPAVTRAIHEMEHYYGVRLFERLGGTSPRPSAPKSFTDTPCISMIPSP